MTRAPQRGKWFIVPAIFFVVYSALLLRIPLFNYLGYEFSVAIALTIPIVIWRLLRNDLKAQSLTPDRLTISSLREITARTQIRSLLLLSIPFLLASLNILFVKNCSYIEGIGFFLLIPVITSLWTQGLSLACLAAFRRPLLWYIILLVMSLLYVLYLGYAYPQIYSYNFVYGFFGGFSYDETLSISIALLLFRLLTVISGLFFYCVAEVIVQKRNHEDALLHTALRGRIVVLLSFGLILFGSWLFRTDLGFESPASFIKEKLGSAYSTEHFKIYYSSRSFNEEEIASIAAMHEFRLSQVERSLQIEFHGMIDSYLYPNADSKRRFIGTGNTNIAKPWKREIHLNKDSWEATLKHELVHVVAGEFGMPVINAHYNTGLVEGLAMAVDDDFGNKTLHEYAASMIRFDIVTDPGPLVKPVGFATQSSAVSYVMMGSFIRFLIDRYGMPRFKELYGGSSVDRTYGIPYVQLIDEWKHLLAGVKVPGVWKRHVEFYFRRPSIFAKQCAHAIANVNERGYLELEKNSPSSAMKEFGCGLMMDWNSESFAGLVRASFAAARYDTVVTLMEKQLEDTIHSSSQINLFLLFGDALWYRDDFITARNVYLELSSYDLSDRMNEAAAVRGIILSHQELRMTLSPYIVGSLSDSAALFHLDTLERTTGLRVVRYLRAKLLFREKKFGEAVTQFESIRESLGDSVLDGRKEQLLGESYFNLKNYQQARVHFWQSLNFVTNASSVKRVEDWISRCEWFARRK